MTQSPPGAWFDPTVGSARLAALRLLDRTKEAGAHKAEVFAVRTEARRLEQGQREVDRHTGFRWTIRAWDEAGRLGVASGRATSPTPADLDRTVGQAIGSIREVPGAEPGPPPRLDVPGRGLDINDHRLPQLDDDMRRAVLASNVDGALQVDRRVAGTDFRYAELHETRAFASSSGEAAEEHGTRFAVIGSAFTEDAAQRVRGQLVSRNFAEVSSRPLGHELASRLVATLTPAELPAEPTAVVLEQRVVAALLPRLVAAFSAERLSDGDSYLRGRVGSRMASSELHVVDDARRPGGMATRGFDERGVPPVSINLIKEGRAAGLYQGPRSAAKVDARPSGHERADGSLWPGNLVVRAGSRSRNMVFPDLGTFVLVDEVTDSAGIDPSTGEIDIGVLVFVADASRVHGCAGIHRLRCSADDLLGGIEKVCNDQQRHGIVDTATWVVQGVWFS